MGKKSGKKPKPTQPRFFGLLPEIDAEKLLKSILSPDSTSSTPPSPTKASPPSDSATQALQSFFQTLQAQDRLIQKPHITLVHQNSKNHPQERELWQECMRLHLAGWNGRPPVFEGKLGWLLCDGRVMAITLEDFGMVATSRPRARGPSASSSSAAPDNTSDNPVLNLTPTVKGRLHMTIGTKDGSVPPVEAKAMVQKWNKGKRKGIWAIEVRVPENAQKSKAGLNKRVHVCGRIKGLLR